MARRILLVGAAVALLLALAGLGLAGWLSSRGRPQRAGAARIAALEQPARVRWDEWGVPHVEAASGRDAAAVVGWLHANDRFAQLELARRAASGRLAELFGPRMLALDRRARVLRLPAAAHAHWEAMGAESRAWLAAYSAGIDAWVAERAGDLPPELAAFGLEPEPWRPTDSLGIGLLLMIDLAMIEWNMDAQRYGWWTRLGPERARELAGDPRLDLDEALHDHPVLGSTRIGAPGGDGGERFGWSNNWAVSGGRARDGSPLVANDPHLMLGLPAVWYQVLVRAPDYEVAGVTLVGLPAVLIGQSSELAWALTNHAADDHDYLIERFDGNGARVQRGDAWLPVLRQREVIDVRGGDPVELVSRWTDVGPLLPADPELGLPARTLNWAAYRACDLLAAFRALAGAADLEGVRRAIEPYRTPTQNLVVGTRQGEIMATVLGRVPARAAGVGPLPVPGWEERGVWREFRPRESAPELVNPPRSFLATANAAVFPPDYPDPYPGEYDTPHRTLRIEELLGSRNDWTPESLARMQSDVTSLYALEVVSMIGRDYEGEARTAAEALAAWDGAMRVAGPAALFALVERELAPAIFGDELGTAGLEPLMGPTRRFAILRVLRGEIDEAWWDDVDTAERETRAGVLAAVLAAAWRAGRTRFGDDVERWSYGALHPWTLRHPLGGLPVLGRWLNRGPFEVPGSRTSISAWYGDWEGEAMPVVAGPSLRWVADVADPDRSRIVLPGGQAGHPFDAHYDDQLPLFLRGESRPVRWSEAAIAEHTESELVFTPR